MEALLRELSEGRDGISEYRDTQLSGEAVTIGSGADRNVQLFGPGIAPEHAVIRLARGRLRLACARGRRARLNAREVTTAALSPGDEIEIAGHRLTILPAQQGFDLTLELRRAGSVDASQLEQAYRTDLERTWLSKRTAAWTGALAVLVLGLLVPLTLGMWDAERNDPPAAWLPSDALWSSGPLLPAHAQAIGEKCSTCHEPFRRVRDDSCRACHEEIVDHVSGARLALTQLGEPSRCATCHREHNEPAAFIVNRADSLCTGCHAVSAEKFGSLELTPVSTFALEAHPAFHAHLPKPALQPAGAGLLTVWRPSVEPVAGATEQSNLKFSHAQHLDAARVLRQSDGGALGCADCHALSADGEHFRPITMAGSCSGCHELTFDPAAPQRQLPHGKPEDVILTLQEYYTRQFTDPSVAAKLRERRRRPGRTDTESACAGSPIACATAQAAEEIDVQFTRRGCIGCHEVETAREAPLLERYRVHPVRLASDYFPAARFDHRSHRIMAGRSGDAACLSCHAAATSEKSAELLVPDIERCVECHGPSATATRIASPCSSCHRYHPAADAAAASGGHAS